MDLGSAFQSKSLRMNSKESVAVPRTSNYVRSRIFASLLSWKRQQALTILP
jgi:hypothetical protein